MDDNIPLIEDKVARAQGIDTPQGEAIRLHGGALLAARHGEISLTPEEARSHEEGLAAVLRELGDEVVTILSTVNDAMRSPRSDQGAT